MKKLFLKLLVLASISVPAHAQNKVVVIPLGGNDGPFADAYYVSVAANGSIISKTPGVISSADGGIDGAYIVKFDVSDIGACFATGTLADTNQKLGSLTGSIGITGAFGTTDSLYVLTEDTVDGSLVSQDRAFTLQLVCPQNTIFPPATTSLKNKTSAPSGNVNINNEPTR